MLQVDGGSGPIILAHAVDRGGIAETAEVLLLGFRSAPAHVKLDAVVDQRLIRR
jgi:hypothetical protein